jgi:proteasome assembly chaperone (PAC2) family protein
MDQVKIIKRPKLKNAYMIVAWPGMGEVAFKAASHLVEQLKAQEFAVIPSEGYFYLTGSVVQNGVLSSPVLPESKFYYWKNPAARKTKKTDTGDLVIFLSNAQPDLNKAQEYSQAILKVAKTFNVRMVISLAAMPLPIEHTHDPQVWVASTNEQLNKELKRFELNNLVDGQISGMNGLFLGIAKKSGLNGFCLLGEIPLYTIQIENPKASAAVLSAIARILNIDIDLARLKEQSDSLDSEINKLLEYLKAGSQIEGPISDEDIEKIKKSLSQLTKLPSSVKENIERLFLEAKSDISKAGDLKRELDKWSVYKEYEDRFLDLFKKSRGQNN